MLVCAGLGLLLAFAAGLGDLVCRTRFCPLRRDGLLNAVLMDSSFGACRAASVQSQKPWASSPTSR